LCNGEVLGHLYFKATEAQVKRAILRAIVSAIPLGENIFHSGPRLVVSEQHIHPDITGSFHINFFANRPLHIHIEAVDRDLWRVEDEELLLSKQSWSRRHTSWQSLLSEIPEVKIIKEAS